MRLILTGWIDPLGLIGLAGTVISGAGAAADLAIAEPTDAFWPKLAVEVVVVGLVATYEWSQSKTESDTCTSSNCCPECIPHAKGTIGYQGPETHNTGRYAGQAHYHIFVVNQNPSMCQCF